jgi:hypothetical protein
MYVCIEAGVSSCSSRNKDLTHTYVCVCRCKEGMEEGKEVDVCVFVWMRGRRVKLAK